MSEEVTLIHNGKRSSLNREEVFKVKESIESYRDDSESGIVKKLLNKITYANKIGVKKVKLHKEEFIELMNSLKHKLSSCYNEQERKKLQKIKTKIQF